MDTKTANKIAKQLMEIIKDCENNNEILKKNKKITLNDLEKVHEKAKKTDKDLNDLHLKYPELGKRLTFNSDSYLSKSPSEILKENKWVFHSSLIKDMEKAIKIEKENEYKKLFEITKRAHIEAINETNVNTANLLKHIKQDGNIAEPDKLKVKQIALIHVYEEKQITRENANEIAFDNGYTSKTSGEGLFQDYTTFLSSANRKGRPNPYTQKKLVNKIELFESIIEHLSDYAKDKANNEIQILKAIMDEDFQ